MRLINKNAFTLVELIVVITILAILWTISFFALGGFVVSARDSNRISDISSMKTVLENYSLQTGFYPKPSDAINITYSGWTVFSQGTFWKSVKRAVKNEIDKVPLDPLFENEYDYSLASNKRSYNLWFIQEWDVWYNNKIIDSSYAATASREIIARVDGTYNGQIMHTYTGGTVYVFWIPSLILKDLDETKILSLTDKFVFDNEANISASYWSGVVQVWSFVFKPQLVYSWSTLPQSPANLKELIINLKGTFLNWDHPTTLGSHKNYRELIDLDVNDPEALYNYGTKFINRDLWWRFKLHYKASCHEIKGTEEDKWSWQYTISPDWYDKVNVYCDMEDSLWWGGWTRIRRWEKWVGYTDIKTVNDTKQISGSELMVVYTRTGALNVGKKFGLYYEKFTTKQYQNDADNVWASVLCWEHTTITDLISQIVSGSWGDCGRTGSTANEYIDIIVDDLWDDTSNAALSDNKKWVGFTKDPCISTGHKTANRNVSWSSNGTVNHRIDNTTALFSLWWAWNRRCLWINSIDQEVLTNEVYVR